MLLSNQTAKTLLVSKTAYLGDYAPMVPVSIATLVSKTSYLGDNAPMVPVSIVTAPLDIVTVVTVHSVLTIVVVKQDLLVTDDYTF